VEFTLSSTLTLRARFFEEKILPPQGLSGTLPARETTDTVVARCAAFQRHARGFHSTVATLDDEYTAAVSNSTVYDDRGRPTTHTLTEQVTAVKPGTLAVEIGYHDDEDPVTFWVRLGRDEKPLRSGQQTLTTRDPDGGCHTLALPYANVPSVWPGVFKALRRKDERFTSERIVTSGCSRPRDRARVRSTSAVDWRIYDWKRFVYVNMPAARVAWDVLSGLHLSDDFVFWLWQQERSADPSPPDDAAPAGK
jgi:hypothetical protein